MKKMLYIPLAAVLSASCNNGTPEPIKINSDKCDFCKMTISDGKFASELITDKGKIYKFDDLHCLVEFSRENGFKNAKYFVSDFERNTVLMPAETAFYIKGENIKSPMMGNTAAFISEMEANEFAEKFSAKKIKWQQFFENE